LSNLALNNPVFSPDGKKKLLKGKYCAIIARLEAPFSGETGVLSAITAFTSVF